MPPPPPAEADAPAEPEPPAAEPAAAEGEGGGEGEEESEEAEAEKEGGGGGAKKKEQLPQPMVLDEGSAALVEFGRAAVLAWRAQCPALLLRACVSMRNWFEGLPAGAAAAAAYGGFEDLTRAKGDESTRVDPYWQPLVAPQLWKPLVRGAEAALDMVDQLREGSALGGTDPVGRTLAALGPAPAGGGRGGGGGGEGGEGGDYALSGVSSVVRGPHRWFQTRTQLEDAVPLDMGWVSEFVLLALRQLQLGRRWRRQEALALQLDDVGEAHFSPKVLPFLEQAQHKIGGSKWCDGPASKPVAQRVAALARDMNGCAAALEACRRTRHELKLQGEISGQPVDLYTPGAAGRALAAEYAACAALCRGKQPVMLVASLGELGLLQTQLGQFARAADSWLSAIDAVFETFEV